MSKQDLIITQNFNINKTMAELDVQPKSSRPWWMWLILALVAIALLFFLLRSCDRDDDAADTANNAETTGTTAATEATPADNDADWNDIDFGLPAVSYEEITDKDINVRGNDDYAIYSIDETILFASDQSTIQPQAAQKLQQITNSMGKRFNGGHVRIYGYTDSQGSAGYNKELAEQRARAVQTWLVQNGDITQDNISLHPVGESRPVASNETAAGRQQNRRVEIVVRRAD
jgi:outer membrane protein OmpA-like peptidoglycan-associated protein